MVFRPTGQGTIMKILFLGDIIGETGRDALKTFLDRGIKPDEIDFIIANGENAAGGVGITPRVAEDIFNAGVNVITTGNHVWQRKEVSDIIDDPCIVRPANFPEGVPGKGYTIVKSQSGHNVCVINMMGRVYMKNLNCPFRTADSIIEKVSKKASVIIVDFHAEITSEKVAFGWFMDGKVSAVLGTHTHVQTADERILPEGTAYITDVGMTGPMDSVIGVKKEIVIKKYLVQMPFRFEVSDDRPAINAVIMEIDEKTAKSKEIKRVNMEVPLKEINGI